MGTREVEFRRVGRSHCLAVAMTLVARRLFVLLTYILLCLLQVELNFYGRAGCVALTYNGVDVAEAIVDHEY